MDKRTLRRLPLNADDIIKRYNSGASPRKIAASCGCSAKAIVNLLCRFGVYRGTENWQQYLFRKTGYTPEKLLDLYNSGIWKCDIASRLGISEGFVGSCLNSLGVPIAKNRSESLRNIHNRGGEERKHSITKNAHDSVRGMNRSAENLIKCAIGRERAKRFGSSTEKALYDLLIDKGVNPIPQKAVHKYNIDLAIGYVAVEISGRSRKPKDIPAMIDRIKYLIDSGYIIVWVWANTTFPVTVGAADYIVSLVNEIGADPAFIRENRVIRCDGKLLSRCGRDSDNFPGIFTPIRGTFSRARH